MPRVVPILQSYILQYKELISRFEHIPSTILRYGCFACKSKHTKYQQRANDNNLFDYTEGLFVKFY